MKTGQNFVAWQPVLTDHQAYTLQELSRQSGAPVIAYVSRLENAVRKAQGWSDTRVTSIERRLLPPQDTLRDCYRRLQAHRHDVHLFCSPFEQFKMMRSLLMAAWLRIDFYLISEPYSPQTEGYFHDDRYLVHLVRRWLRPLAYQCYALLIRRRTSGIFAISSLAVRQYLSSGVSAGKLFPFGYFVPHVAGPAAPWPKSIARPTELRLVFVGNLIRRKGLDLLISAVKRLLAEGYAVTLDVFGPGSTEPYAFDARYIRHLGLIPFGQSQSVIAGYDALVLPSRYDGWGVVVNEALSAHVPVVCSSHVGARTLVENFGAGSVFTSDDAGALCQALKHLLTDAKALPRMREAAARAEPAIEPAVAARYMLAVINAAPRAKADIASPWYAAPSGARTDISPTVRLHLTNVAGAGAIQLLKSLLPAVESAEGIRVTHIHLPNRGDLAHYRPHGAGTKAEPYRRRLPNAISRLLECTWLGGQFNGTSPLLVFGDVPLRCKAPQTVFVQTPHMIPPATPHRGVDRFKYAIARWIFRRNARHVRAFIVQTPVMKVALTANYPEIADRIHVVAQPVPAWLLNAHVVRCGRRGPADAKLSLVYPAAVYPHKNHRLLAGIDPSAAIDWPVERLTLTISPEHGPAAAVPWLTCRGFLPPDQMIALYAEVDALLFLSTDESYGFPLVEAMFVGLPVVCPDLPYARALCEDGAIYFDPHSVNSLHAALLTLHGRLRTGWWPDWSRQLAALPRDWESVANSMLSIALGADAGAPPHAIPALP